MSTRQRFLAVIVVAACAYASALLLQRLHLHLVARAVTVFAVAKLAGDLLEALARGFSEVIFYEDFLRDLIAFAFLGLVTAGAIAAGRLWTGAEVSPALPAVGAYAFFQFMPRRRRGMGNEPY